MFQDYLDLLQCLNDHRIRYLIIGGYAVIHYAEPRYTKDLDIWFEPTESNARKLINALESFGAPTENLSVDELKTPGLVYVFGVPPVRVDMLNKPKGATFKTAWKNKKSVEVSGVKMNFVDRNTLKKLKRAVGRPQDLADLEKL